MQVKDFKTLLSETNLPVGYYQFPKGKVPKLPYILYYFPDWDDLLADNINYVNIAQANIELYTKNKDFKTEFLLEEILNNKGLYFSKSESYLTDEEMYEVLYQVRVLIKKQEV